MEEGFEPDILPAGDVVSEYREGQSERIAQVLRECGSDSDGEWRERNVEVGTVTFEFASGCYSGIGWLQTG